MPSSAQVTRCWTALILAYLGAYAGAQDAAQPARAATLGDLYSELNIVDTAISVSGRYVAAIARLEQHDVLVTFDLNSGDRKVIQRVGHDEAGKDLLLRMVSVQWKSDERMLLRLRVRPKDVLNFFTVSDTKISKMGQRLFAVDRNGKAVGLLADNRNAAMEGAFDLGDIRSILPNDPRHILMELDGFNGRSLFKVNVETGHGEQIERPFENVTGWWLDVNGNPMVRVSASKGTVRMSGKDESDKWRVFYTMREKDMDEREEYVPMGPSSDPARYYVLAHPPGHDRMGLYLYDVRRGEFGAPVQEHASYDLDYARISLDGSHVQFYCYTAHVRTCEFSDASVNAQMLELRKHFGESANVHVHDISEDRQTFLLYVEGPRDPPGYYYYQASKRDLQWVGSRRKALEDVARPASSVFSWKARDGRTLDGYLTLPPNAPARKAGKLPLVVHPHGGPEARDQLAFDPWVQYFAARGYGVFQPNFRGSAGFGRAFAESGYGEWGRKMQDDIIDGVKSLVDQEIADPARMCIVGASYGGYAALAGAALTPDLFKCAVSIAGVSDLEDFISWRKRNWGTDSEGYRYWLTAIGDPEKDARKLRETSPRQLANRIRIPVLLIHGTQDFVVPVAQSRAMKRALDKAGMKTELIELEKEGHSFLPHNEVKMLTAIDEFLWKHLGPGYEVTTPPVSRGALP